MIISSLQPILQACRQVRLAKELFVHSHSRSLELAQASQLLIHKLFKPRICSPII